MVQARDAAHPLLCWARSRDRAEHQHTDADQLPVQRRYRTRSDRRTRGSHREGHDVRGYSEHRIRAPGARVAESPNRLAEWHWHDDEDGYAAARSDHGAVLVLRARADSGMAAHRIRSGDGCAFLVRSAEQVHGYPL